jgi:hypothetical protein
MSIEEGLSILQREVCSQVGGKVDIYYYEGFGVLCLQHGRPLHPSNVIYAMPDEVFSIQLTRRY